MDFLSDLVSLCGYQRTAAFRLVTCFRAGSRPYREGQVVQRYFVDGKEKKVTYTHALHTPTLNANLISVSAFDKAGLMTTFGGGQGIITKNDGTIVLTGRCDRGMYLVDVMNNLQEANDTPMAMSSLSQSTSLEQWHRRLTHCSPSTIQEMANHNLVDGLRISGVEMRGKCEDCILGCQTRRPFDSETEKGVDPLELVSFDLWGPSHTQSAGGKTYLMLIIDGGTSYKDGAYLSDKSDSSTITAFDTFRAKAESLTNRKIRRLRTNRAYQSTAWADYCCIHSIIHEFTAPYSSAQNGLAKRGIRTTMDDVHTLLRDSGLNHSYWCEAAAYSINTRNIIPSRHHPGKIPLELFSGKRQTVAHLRVFSSRCWVKIPTINGMQITGGSKLDSRGVECRLLGYASGCGIYKVQEVASRRVLISRDVVFEEGHPHRTSPVIGENDLPLFDTLDDKSTFSNGDNSATTPTVNPLGTVPTPPSDDVSQATGSIILPSDDPGVIPQVTEPRRSAQIPQPSASILESRDYQQRELLSRQEGDNWAIDRIRPCATSATDSFDLLSFELDDYVACLAEMKASHNIPRSYRHATSSDLDWWMVPMQIEMDTLKRKHTWDLVKLLL